MLTNLELGTFEKVFKRVQSTHKKQSQKITNRKGWKIFKDLKWKISYIVTNIEEKTFKKMFQRVMPIHKKQ